MSGFTKLFASILDSTIWTEPDHIRLLWITMLAMANRDGEVLASIPGLAKRAGISLAQVEEGILRFKQPDKYSRTPDNEGRRIADTDGGWRLLNHGKYRALMSAEERREYNRRKQAERRAKLKSNVNDASMTVNDNQQCQHIAEAEAEAITPIVPKGTDRQDPEFPLDLTPRPKSPLPERWRNIPKVDRRNHRVAFNTQEMERIGSWFGRKPGTLWTIAEGVTLLEMIKPSHEEVGELEEYYFAEITERDHRRRDLLTLLNNWAGELDRARLWKAENP